MLGLWRVITIIRRNPFESLHPVLEDALQSFDRDLIQYVPNSRQ
jgi:hypothetical protein